MSAPATHLKAFVCAVAAFTLTAISTWTLAEGVYTAEARATVTVEVIDDSASQAPLHVAQAG